MHSISDSITVSNVSEDISLVVMTISLDYFGGK